MTGERLQKGEKENFERQLKAMSQLRGLLVVSKITLALMTGSGISQPQSVLREEYWLKADSIRLVIPYVTWPDEVLAKQPGVYTVGLVGEVPFPKPFQELHRKELSWSFSLKKEVLGEISFRNFGAYRPGLPLKEVQVLFIARSERRNLGAILKELQGTAVLTVGEDRDFLECGGMIRAYGRRNRIRLDINRAPVKRSPLSLDANLLRTVGKNGRLLPEDTPVKECNR